MPKEVLNPSEIERLQEEHKILMECVTHYANPAIWRVKLGVDEEGFTIAQIALEKIRSLRDVG